MDEEKMEEWIERFEEARELRRKYADWIFIKSQPERIKIALEYYVETGDYRGAAQMAEMAVDEFVNIAKEKAKIPTAD
jgi:PaREP6 domain containing protein